MSRMKLGWFNAWVGYSSLVLFIPSFLFFVNYESFLKRSFDCIPITEIKFEIKKDSSVMKIITDQGTFKYYERKYFEAIIEQVSTGQTVEIWGKNENKTVADIKVADKFIIPKSNGLIATYIIGLIFSTTFLALSTIVVIQTKGWGTYELMEKHKKK